MPSSDRNVDALLNLYAQLYTHYKADGNDEENMYEELADFANLIATKPFDYATQAKASHLEHEMIYYHKKTIDEMEEGVNYRIYPCECLKEYINARVAAIEMIFDDLDEDNEEDKEKMDTLSTEYEKWLSYQKYQKYMYFGRDTCILTSLPKNEKFLFFYLFFSPTVKLK